MRKIIEAGIRDIKSSDIKYVVNGSGNLNDFVKGKSEYKIFSQVVEYVKSLKSLKDAKAMKDFCGYASRGKEIEKLYNSSNDSEKDDLYDYVVSVCKQYDSKYKSVFSKIIKNFSDLDKKEPNVLDALMNDNDEYFSKKICDKFYITIESKNYAGYANVNNKYYISIWLAGESDDDWIGSADEDGFTFNLMGPSSCRKNLYVCVSKIYMCYAFEENINKIKSGIDNFIKDNF